MPSDADTATRADYAEILERADQGVGQIVAALAKAGVANNTLIIFTNDNGGEWLSRNAPLFNRKFSLWEAAFACLPLSRGRAGFPESGSRRKSASRWTSAPRSLPRQAVASLPA